MSDARAGAPARGRKAAARRTRLPRCKPAWANATTADNPLLRTPKSRSRCDLRPPPAIALTMPDALANINRAWGLRRCPRPFCGTCVIRATLGAILRREGCAMTPDPLGHSLVALRARLRRQVPARTVINPVRSPREIDAHRWLLNTRAPRSTRTHGGRRPARNVRCVATLRLCHAGTAATIRR
jgi:hypothetical protein